MFVQYYYKLPHTLITGFITTHLSDHGLWFIIN